jgi:ADP-heptose:LPS heptosyltransferase
MVNRSDVLAFANEMLILTNSKAEMAQAIKHADKFMTINSAPAVLASALRKYSPSYFLPKKEQWAQDNIAPWLGRVDVEL